MTVEKQKTYYTVTEVAELLRISRQTVYRMIHDCVIEYAEVNHSYRILAAPLHKMYPELKERL